MAKSPRKAHKPKGASVKLGRAIKGVVVRGKARAQSPNGTPRGKRVVQAAGYSLQPVECPDCHQMIARKYLANHIRKVHSAADTTGNGQSRAVAPAAA